MSKKKQEIRLKLAHADMENILRLEKKVDFLMKKQAQRDLDESLIEMGVDPNA